MGKGQAAQPAGMDGREMMGGGGMGGDNKRGQVFIPQEREGEEGAQKDLEKFLKSSSAYKHSSATNVTAEKLEMRPKLFCVFASRTLGSVARGCFGLLLYIR